MKRLKKAIYNLLFRIFAKKTAKKYTNKQLNSTYCELVRMINSKNYGKYEKNQVIILRDTCKKELKKRGLL